MRSFNQRAPIAVIVVHNQLLQDEVGVEGFEVKAERHHDRFWWQ